MTETEFLISYNIVVVILVIAIALWRIKNNWSVINSVPLEAEIVAIEKDVDVVVSINIKIKTRNNLSIEQVYIDPMRDKTDYCIGSTYSVWVNEQNPNLYFTSKPNAFKLIGKIGFHSFVIWFLLCGMLLAFFSKI